MESKHAELLKSHGLRVTAQRLEAISAIDSYPSAIPYSKVKAILNDFDRVTLYRTLLALEEKGIIHKIQTGEQEVFYALCGDSCSTHDHKHQHVHFKCSSCDEVTCVDVKTPMKISIDGHTINSLEVQATGVCADCA